jgi:hypothetical protein
MQRVRKIRDNPKVSRRMKDKKDTFEGSGSDGPLEAVKFDGMSIRDFAREVLGQEEV